MTFIYDQLQKPALRYALLAGFASLPLFGSLTSLSLAAVCGASLGVGLLTTLIIEVGLYFKSIGDDAKLTITELRETIENVKKSTKTVEDEKTIAHLTEAISEIGKTAKALQKNLAFDPKKGEKPIGKEVSETLDELTKTLNKLGKNFETNPKNGQQPLAQQLTEAVEKINSSVEKINSGMDVAGTVFYPLTSTLNGVKKLGCKIGVLAASDKSAAAPEPTHLTEKPALPSRSAQDRRVAVRSGATQNPPRTRTRKAGLL